MKSIIEKFNELGYEKIKDDSKCLEYLSGDLKGNRLDLTFYHSSQMVWHTQYVFNTKGRFIEALPTVYDLPTLRKLEPTTMVERLIKEQAKELGWLANRKEF